MNKVILIQALQSEGVVDAVIYQALLKVEMYNIEERVGRSINRAIYQAGTNQNRFEAQTYKPMKVQKAI